MHRAFRGCWGLTSITIPDSVTSIGMGAFGGCSSLTTIEVGAGNMNYTEVNGVLFNKEKTLLHTYPVGKTGANYVIPDSVTSIGEWAFAECANLTSITIPDGVTSIGHAAFAACESMNAVTFLGDAPKVKNDDTFKYSSSIIYRKPEAKGWGDTFGDRPVKLIGEAPSEKLIVDTASAKNGKKFPSSTKELMFGSNPVVTDKDKAFWEAAKSGNLEVVQRLLSEGVDVDIYDSTVGAVSYTHLTLPTSDLV